MFLMQIFLSIGAKINYMYLNADLENIDTKKGESFE